MANTSVLDTLKNLKVTLTKNGDEATGTVENLPLTQVVKELFPAYSLDLTVLPTINFTTITVTYNTTSNTGSLSADFIFDSQTCAFNLDIAKDEASGDINFIAVLALLKEIDVGAKLPLVGEYIAGDFEFNAAYLIVTSKSTTGVTSSAKDQPDTITPGISFGISYVFAGKDKETAIPVHQYPATSGKDAGSVTDEPSGKEKLDEEVGPISVTSLTLTYANEVINCAIDADLTMGPIEISLDGLSIGYSLKEYDATFDLLSLGFDYDEPPMKIEGAINHVEPPPQDTSLEFSGDLVVQAEMWGLSALASYAKFTDGNVSFFIFADFDGILGGPEFFIVTGLMGGFGYNRSLKFPTYDEVADFPFLGLQGKGKSADEVLTSLESGWVAPKQGDYWLAAGIQFTSFEIIFGKILLMAEFGKDLEFGVLGTASLALPKGVGDEALVYIELQMEAELAPKEGYFSVGASLTKNSYILTKDCHLTGGFAFDIWFGDNPKAGQFVFTAGGYHPAFQPPSYFPKPDRLGFNWKVSSDISIKGGNYFATTPSCGMAGGSLNALFQSGPVKAWFDAGMNMLVTWHPFHFDGNISISIGASVKVDLLLCHTTVSVSLGASLNVWGSPLGGKVKVHIVIVTVTISFGSSEATTLGTADPLSWDDFSSKLLPKADICQIINNAGLTKKLKKAGATDALVTESAPDSIWVVRAGSFSFSTQSSIPSSYITYGESGSITNEFGSASDTMNVRPMFSNSASSTHNLKITDSNGAVVDITHPDQPWTATANKSSVPENLWGAPIADSANISGYTQNPKTPTANVLKDQMVGYTLTAPPPIYSNRFGPIAISILSEENIDNEQPVSPLNDKAAANTDNQPAKSKATISDMSGNSGIGATTTIAARSAVWDVLNANGIYTGDNDSMAGMNVSAPTSFSASPLEKAS